MTRSEVNMFLAAILMASKTPGGATEGGMYAALMHHGVTLDDFYDLLTIATTAGLVKRSHFVVTLTPKGEEMVTKIEALEKAS